MNAADEPGRESWLEALEAGNPQMSATMPPPQTRAWSPDAAGGGRHAKTLRPRGALEEIDEGAAAAADLDAEVLRRTLEEMDVLLLDDMRNVSLPATHAASDRAWGSVAKRHPPTSRRSAKRHHVDHTGSLGLLSGGGATLPSLLHSRPQTSGQTQPGGRWAGGRYVHEAHGVNLKAIASLATAKLATPVPTKKPSLQTKSQFNPPNKSKLDFALAKCAATQSDDQARLQRVKRCAKDTHLKHLDIDETWTSKDVVELCSVIAAHPSLTSLNVQNTSLTTAALGELHTAVSRNKRITILRTSDPHGRTVSLSAAAAVNARSLERKAARHQAVASHAAKAASVRIAVEQLALIAVCEADARGRVETAQRARMADVLREEQKRREVVALQVEQQRVREIKLRARRRVRVEEVAARADIVEAQKIAQRTLQRHGESIHRTDLRSREARERNVLRAAEKKSWADHKIVERERVAFEQAGRDELAKVEAEKRARIAKTQDKEGNLLREEEEEAREQALAIQNARLDEEESERKRKEQAVLQAQLEAEWTKEKARRAREQFETLQYNERLDVIDGENRGRHNYLLQREAQVQTLRDWQALSLRVAQAGERLTKVLAEFKRTLARLTVDPVCRFKDFSTDAAMSVFFYNTDRPTLAMKDLSLHAVLKERPVDVAETLAAGAAGGDGKLCKEDLNELLRHHATAERAAPQYTKGEVERLNRLPSEVGTYYEGVKQNHALLCQTIDHTTKAFQQLSGDGHKGLKKLFPRFTVYTSMTKKFELPTLAQLFCVLTYPREAQVTLTILPPDEATVQAVRKHYVGTPECPTRLSFSRRQSMQENALAAGGRTSLHGYSRQSFRDQVSQGKVQNGNTVAAARRSVHHSRRESMEIDHHMQRTLLGSVPPAPPEPLPRTMSALDIGRQNTGHVLDIGGVDATDVVSVEDNITPRQDSLGAADADLSASALWGGEALDDIPLAKEEGSDGSPRPDPKVRPSSRERRAVALSPRARARGSPSRPASPQLPLSELLRVEDDPLSPDPSPSAQRGSVAAPPPNQRGSIAMHKSQRGSLHRSQRGSLAKSHRGSMHQRKSVPIHPSAVSLSGIEMPPELPNDILKTLTKKYVSIYGQPQPEGTERYPDNIGTVYPQGAWCRGGNALTVTAGNVSPAVLGDYLRRVGYWCSPHDRGAATAVMKRTIDVSVTLQYSFVNPRLVDSPTLQCFSGTEQKTVSFRVVCVALPPYVAVPRRPLRATAAAHPALRAPRPEEASAEPSPELAPAAAPDGAAAGASPPPPPKKMPDFAAFAYLPQQPSSYLLEVGGMDETTRVMDLIVVHGSNPLARGRDKAASQFCSVYHYGEKVDGEDFCADIVVDAPSMIEGAADGRPASASLTPFGGGSAPVGAPREKCFEIGIYVEFKIHMAKQGDRVAFKPAAFDEQVIEFRHKASFNRGNPCIAMGNDVLLQVSEGDIANTTGASATVRNKPPEKLISPALLPGARLHRGDADGMSELMSEGQSSEHHTTNPSAYSQSESGASARPGSADGVHDPPRTLTLILSVRRTMQQDLFAFVLSRFRYQNAALRNRLGKIEEEKEGEEDKDKEKEKVVAKKDSGRLDKRAAQKKLNRLYGRVQKGKQSDGPLQMVAPVPMPDGSVGAPEASERHVEVSVTDLGGHVCTVKFPLTASGGPNYTQMATRPGPAHLRSLCVAWVPEDLRAYLSAPSERSVRLFEHASFHHNATSKFNLHPDPCLIEAFDISIALTFGARRGDNVLLASCGELQLRQPDSFGGTAPCQLFYRDRCVGSVSGTAVGSIDDGRHREMDYEMADHDRLTPTTNALGLGGATGRSAKHNARLLFDRVPIGHGAQLPELSDPPMPNDQLRLAVRLEVPQECRSPDAEATSADFGTGMLEAVLRQVVYCNASQSPVVGIREIEVRVQAHIQHPDYSEGAARYVTKTDYFSVLRPLRVCPPMVSVPTRVCKVELPEGAQRLGKFDTSHLAVADVESFAKGEIVVEIVAGYNPVDHLHFNNEGTDLKLLRKSVAGKGKKAKPKGDAPAADLKKDASPKRPPPAGKSPGTSPAMLSSPLTPSTGPRSPVGSVLPPVSPAGADEEDDPQLIFWGDSKIIGTLHTINDGQKLVIKLGKAVGKTELIIMMRSILFRTLQAPPDADPAAPPPAPPQGYNYKKVVTLSISDGGLPSVLPIEVNVISQTPRTELLLPMSKVKYRCFTASLAALEHVLPIAPQGRCILRSTAGEPVDCRGLSVTVRVEALAAVDGDRLAFLSPQQQLTARHLYVEHMKPRDTKLAAEVLAQNMWDGVVRLGDDNKIRVVREGVLRPTAGRSASTHDGQSPMSPDLASPAASSPASPPPVGQVAQPALAAFAEDGWVLAELVSDTATTLRVRLTEGKTPEPLTLAHLSYLLNCIGFTVNQGRVVPGPRGVAIDIGSSQDPVSARMTVEVAKQLFWNIPQQLLACPVTLKRRGTSLIPYPMITLSDGHGGGRLDKGSVEVVVERQEDGGIPMATLHVDDNHPALDGRSSRIDSEIFYFRGDVVGKLAVCGKHRVRFEYTPFYKATTESVGLLLQMIFIRHDPAAGAIPEHGFDVKLFIADGGGEPSQYVVNVQASADLALSMQDSSVKDFAELASSLMYRPGSRRALMHAKSKFTIRRGSRATSLGPNAQSPQ